MTDKTVGKKGGPRQQGRVGEVVTLGKDFLLCIPWGSIRQRKAVTAQKEPRKSPPTTAEPEF